MGVGVIGCGEISTRYLRELSAARGVRLVGCASRNAEAAAVQAAACSVPALGIEQLLASPDVALVVNLTAPAAHAEITRRALEAGKHVYSEKPLAAGYEEGAALLALAASRDLSLACAPATHLGPAQQTMRRLVDSGALGAVTLASTSIVYSGPDLWHPTPERLFAADVGPLRDMGVYQLNALVNLLGSIAEVYAVGGRSRLTRVAAKGAGAGAVFDVEAPSHVLATLRFEAGAQAVLTVSFDAPWTRAPGLEIQGVSATISGPGAGRFEGGVRTAAAPGAWEDIPNALSGWGKDLWLIGVLEQVEAIGQARAPRACAPVALHVVTVLEAIERSLATGHPWPVRSRCERPEPLELDAYAKLRQTHHLPEPHC